MADLINIIGVERPLIGMIHFPPLTGYEGYPGFEYIMNKAIKEAEILTAAGMDAIMVENNYNMPHVEAEPENVRNMMIELTKGVCTHTTLPVGVSTLWNDYQTSLAICASSRASFIRVPAFVDNVRTSYGDMMAKSAEVIAERDELGLKRVAILADVQVKHSEMLDKNKPLSQSVTEAVAAGADAIIITGKWTGDAPQMDDLATAKQFAQGLPILVGSGATVENLPHLLEYATGVIVGTAIKEGQSVDKSIQVNLKPFEYSIDPERAQEFVHAFQKASGF